MDASRILSLGKRIATQCLRDKRTMALIIAAPSLVMLLLAYFFSTSAGSITIGVVLDHRTGTEHLSQLIADGLNASDNVTVVYLEEKDINASLNNKSVDGVIYFPPNFTRNVLDSKPSYVKIVTHGNNPSAGGIIAQKFANVSAKVLGSRAPVQPAASPALAMPSVEAEVLYGEGYKSIDFFAPYILGLIAFIFVFMFTSVTFLRERSFGTLERLMVSPITRAEIIIGYMLGFLVFAAIQSSIILLFAIFVLNVKMAGGVLAVVVVQFLLTLVAVNLGIFCSSFAKNELQAIQFIPLVLLPQIFLDGMFWPVSTFPNYLQALSYIMPLTYANDALQGIMVQGVGLGDIWVDILVLLGFAVAMIVLSTLTLNKQLQ
ncbi:MAG TPA: ABC transporter permease [Methanocella sp.]|uniref:ABC transporter permease n=1 Tax=Methanocella sp. TaxID=2052833 RepID=UPI002CA929A0|nr:ABC transporter permease [Methanocella sp.]HTY91839.1 ABC transporter permease [Methanocella sp.]